MQYAEPNFNLIKPGRIGRQPMHLELKWPLMRTLLFSKPGFELFGCMCRAIVEDDMHRVNLAVQGFRHQYVENERLEIYKAFALSTLAVHLTIRHTQCCKQLQCASPLISSRCLHRLARLGCSRRLGHLSSLDGGLFIDTNHPFPLLQQRLGLPVKLQYRTSPLQKGLRVKDVLPGMVPPWLDLLFAKPSSNGADSDLWHQA